MNGLPSKPDVLPIGSMDVRNLSQRIAVAQAWLGAALLFAIPLLDNVRPTDFPRHATLHALSAVSMVVLGGYAGHHAMYLLRGAIQRIPFIRRLSYGCAGLLVLIIVGAHWAHIPHGGTGGAGQPLLGAASFFHSVLTEFKEFICLLPLPLYAAFLLWQYDAQAARDNWLATAIGVLLIAAWAFLITGAVAGISIAKVQLL
jgi:hypothetical protein